MSNDYKVPKGYTMVDSQHKDIDEEAPVIIRPEYVGEGESPKKYCVCELSKGYYLIADNKKQLRNGEGHIYSVWSIACYKNFS